MCRRLLVSAKCVPSKNRFVFLSKTPYRGYQFFARAGFCIISHRMLYGTWTSFSLCSSIAVFVSLAMAMSPAHSLAKSLYFLVEPAECLSGVSRLLYRRSFVYFNQEKSVVGNFFPGLLENFSYDGSHKLRIELSFPLREIYQRHCTKWEVPLLLFGSILWAILICSRDLETMLWTAKMYTFRSNAWLFSKMS